MKVSARANSNLALVKYWGKYDSNIKTPMNDNLAMVLDALHTTTTVEFGDYNQDKIILNGEDASDDKKILGHIDRIRERAGIDKNAKVVSENNFPTAAGLASSASGLSALTIAGCKAAGLDLGKKELSMISRKGSGSSSRSIYGGFVEWRAAAHDKDSYAIQVKDEDWMDIRDVVAVVEESEKSVGSTAGMATTIENCPLYQGRQADVHKNLMEVRAGILDKDFERIGKYSEYDSLSMHATMMTTRPPLVYWAGGTVEVIHLVEKLREEGIPAYHSIDAGPNVQVLTLPEYEDEVKKRIEEIPQVQRTITSGIGKGARELDDHLF